MTHPGLPTRLADGLGLESTPAARRATYAPRCRPKLAPVGSPVLAPGGTRLGYTRAIRSASANLARKPAGTAGSPSALVPKLCLGTALAKLRFANPERAERQPAPGCSRETEFRCGV